MSTIEDFENAPIGATASSAETNARYVKSPDRWLLFDGRGDWRVDEYDLESAGFALNPATPTSAREALDLAWELAHPVKEGQTMPSDTQYLLRHGLGYNLEVALGARRVDSIDAESIRTLDPLPDPEPDWLDAPHDPEELAEVDAEFDRWLEQVKAEAWEEGNAAGWTEATARHENVDTYPKLTLTNPYRTETDR